MRVLLTICLLMLFGCEMVVDLDVPFKGPSLVINSVVDPASPWMAIIGRNRHVLDTTTRRVENALVVVYADDLPVDTLAHDQFGIYRSADTPREGVEYEIRVSAPDFQDASGRASVPVAAKIKNITTSENVWVDGRLIAKVDITFDDDGATENYYELMVETVEDVLSESGEIHEFRRAVLLESREQLNGVAEGDPTFALQFKDILFNGREKVLPFQTIYANFNSAKSIVFTLSTISKDLYEYRTTLNAQHLSGDNPFAQPVSVYNNIQNGFGIFAGASSVNSTITTPGPIITSISPKEVKRGDVIVITGENLDNGANVDFTTGKEWFAFSNEVRWNGNQLEVVVPREAITGKIYISKSGWIIPGDIVILE